MTETVPLLIAAAFLAGALNAVAGGGTFLSLPALVFAGLSPVAANATSTVVLLPGYLSAALGFRKDVRAINDLGVLWLLAISAVGGAIGALLLLATPDDAFRAVVPWLVLVATALFAFGHRLATWLQSHAMTGATTMAVTLLIASIYGGYFNGGLGILLLAAFSLFGETNLNTMNGLKNLISATLTVIAVVTYTAADAVHWPEALMMMVSAMAGGYAGAKIAQRTRPTSLRIGIVAIGLIVAAWFFAT